MSFVVKTVKKVFDFGKKVVKSVGKVFKNKWFRVAALTALTVFTTGLGSAGFSGFGASMEAAKAAGKSALGSFFSAVGTTMATGFATIKGAVTGALGIGKEAVTPAAPTGNPLLWRPSVNPAQLDGGGIWDSAKNYSSKIIGTLFGNTAGGSAMRNALMTGIAFSAQGGSAGGGGQFNLKARSNIYGGRARGGSAELPDSTIRRPITQSSGASPQPTQIGQTQGTPREVFTPKTPEGIEAPLLGKATQIANIPGFNNFYKPLLAEDAGRIT